MSSKKSNKVAPLFEDPEVQEAYEVAQEIAISLNKSRDRLGNSAADWANGNISQQEHAERMDTAKLAYDLLLDGYTIAIENFRAVAPERGALGFVEARTAMTKLTKLALGRA